MTQRQAGFPDLAAKDQRPMKSAASAKAHRGALAVVIILSLLVQPAGFSSDDTQKGTEVLPKTEKTGLVSPEKALHDISLLSHLRESASTNKFLGFKGTHTELFGLIQNEPPGEQVAAVAAAFPPPDEKPVEFLRRLLGALRAVLSGGNMYYVEETYGIDHRAENDVLSIAKSRLETGFENLKDLSNFATMLKAHQNPAGKSGAPSLAEDRFTNSVGFPGVPVLHPPSVIPRPAPVGTSPGLEREGPKISAGPSLPEH
jgi:hypothetical protein